MGWGIVPCGVGTKSVLVREAVRCLRAQAGAGGAAGPPPSASSHARSSARGGSAPIQPGGVRAWGQLRGAADSSPVWVPHLPVQGVASHPLQPHLMPESCRQTPHPGDPQHRDKGGGRLGGRINPPSTSPPTPKPRCAGAWPLSLPCRARARAALLPARCGAAIFPQHPFPLRRHTAPGCPQREGCRGGCCAPHLPSPPGGSPHRGSLPPSPPCLPQSRSRRALLPAAPQRWAGGRRGPPARAAMPPPPLPPPPRSGAGGDSGHAGSGAGRKAAMPGLRVRTGAQGAALFFSPFFLFFFSPPPLCIHQPSLLPLHHRGHLHPLAVFRNCSNFLPCDPTPGSSPRRPQAGAGVSAEPPARCHRRGPSHGREMRLPAPEQRRGGGGDAHPPAPQPLGQHRAASPAAGRWAPRAAPPAGRHPGHAVPAGQCRGGSRGEAVARVSPRGAGSCWAVGCVGGSW